VNVRIRRESCFEYGVQEEAFPFVVDHLDDYTRLPPKSTASGEKHTSSTSHLSIYLPFCVIMKLLGTSLSLLPLLLSLPLSTLAKNGKRDAIAYLSDVHSIRQTINLYPLALDFKELDRLDALFTENATYSISTTFGTVYGVEAIKAKIREVTGDAQTQHLFATETLDVDSEAGTATGNVYLLETVFGLLGPNVTNTFNGYFNDKFKRTREGEHWPELEWRFSSREFIPLVSDGFSLCGETFGSGKKKKKKKDNDVMIE
jgi:SnoaL-like domain